MSALTAAAVLRESRRNAARREVTLPCQAVREHDFRLIAERTLDISAEGMLLPLRTEVAIGESVLVSFQIPGRWIDLEATVARIVHGRRPGDDGLAVGLVFHAIAPSARAALAAYLHGRRTPLPRRGPLASLRRGAPAPRLADEALMLEELANVADVVEDEDEPSVDAASVLRAVVDAWQSLVLASQQEAAAE